MQSELERVFVRQRELVEKFVTMEYENGMFPDRKVPVDLDSKVGQLRMKFYAWCATEEIAEAILSEAKRDLPGFREEVADVFTFFIDLMILAGVDLTDSMTDVYVSNSPSAEERDSVWLDVIVDLGTAMNRLKNKVWNKKSIPLGLGRAGFRSLLVDAFRTFIRACLMNRIPLELLYSEYWKKAAINEKRAQEYANG